MLDLLLMYIILAGVFTFGKQAVLHSSPFFLTAVRYIPAGLIFLAGTYLFKRKNFYFKSAYIPSLIGVTVFFFIMDSFRLIGLQYIPASYAALFSSLSPFIAALLANLIYKEKFTFKKTAALLLGFFGVLPLILQNLADVSACTTIQLVGGYASLLLSVISVVLGTFFLKKLVDQEKYSVFMVFGICLFSGGVLALIGSLCFESWNPMPITDMATVLPIIFFLFVTHNLISQPVYGFLVKKYPVTLVTFATLTTPLATALLNWYLYGHSISWIFLFSLCTLALSFGLFYHEEYKEKLIH